MVRLAPQFRSWRLTTGIGGWIDWERLALAPLPGPAAAPGDLVTIRSRYIDGAETAGFGVTETESGCHAAAIDLAAEDWGLA